MNVHITKWFRWRGSVSDECRTKWFRWRGPVSDEYITKWFRWRGSVSYECRTKWFRWWGPRIRWMYNQIIQMVRSPYQRNVQPNDSDGEVPVSDECTTKWFRWRGPRIRWMYNQMIQMTSYIHEDGNNEFLVKRWSEYSHTNQTTTDQVDFLRYRWCHFILLRSTLKNRV